MASHSIDINCMTKVRPCCYVDSSSTLLADATYTAGSTCIHFAQEQTFPFWQPLTSRCSTLRIDSVETSRSYVTISKCALNKLLFGKTPKKEKVNLK